MALFTPVILTCLIASPTQCRPVLGVLVETEAACVESLAVGLEYMRDNLPDNYAAGVACIQTHLMDEQANSQ